MVFRIILTLAILLNASSLTSQCLITESEYYDSIGDIDNIDPIVGLWKLTGETKLFEGDSLVSHQNDPFLGYWFIVPKGDLYEVCHTEYTDVQNFNAPFRGIGSNEYIYNVNYGSEERKTALARDYDSTEISDIDKLITYKLVPSKATAIFKGAEEGQRIEWTFYWSPINIEDFFTPDIENQANVYEDLKLTYGGKVWTQKELDALKRTHNNEFAIHIRAVLDSGHFHDIIGFKDLPIDISDDKFFVVSVNDYFPNRRSYYILFDKYDANIWRVDFSIDNQGNLMNIISFNKSQYHSSDCIDLIKSIEALEKYDFWR